MNTEHGSPGDLGDHEIAELRAAADRAPWLEGQQMHRLLDAYEKWGEVADECDELQEQIEELEPQVVEARNQARKADAALTKLRKRLEDVLDGSMVDEVLDLIGDVRDPISNIVEGVS